MTKICMRWEHSNVEKMLSQEFINDLVFTAAPPLPLSLVSSRPVSRHVTSWRSAALCRDKNVKKQSLRKRGINARARYPCLGLLLNSHSYVVKAMRTAW